MRRLRVKVEGKYGYVDEHGEIAIPLQYEYASKFSEGLASVCRKEANAVFVIDMEGKVQGTLVNANTRLGFSEGRIAFSMDDDNDRGYLDTQARVVIRPSFSTALPFNDGLALVIIDRKYGVIDRQGNWVIRPQFDHLWPFNKGEDITAFLQDDKWGLVNRSGEIVLQPRFDDACHTYQGLTPVSLDEEADKSYGFVDASGKWVVPPKFDDRGNEWNDGTLPVAVDEKWGVVDIEGNWIIPPKYTSANAFHDGLSRVFVGGCRNEDYYLEDGKFGFVDRNDKLVIRAKFDDANDFNDGVAAVEEFAKNDPEADRTKRGWIDTTGKFIWKPTR